MTKGNGPLVGTAIHSGHQIRSDIARLLAVDEHSRLREEDPFTELWTDLTPNRIIVDASRFEFDLNRTLQKAVYMTPEDAWGLDVWERSPSKTTVLASLYRYKQFYDELDAFLTDIHSTHGPFVVLDFHSYCHRRGGPESPPDDPGANPEINIGTGSLNGDRWSGLVKRMSNELRGFDFEGRSLDVRENIKFRGGQFPSWINSRYSGDSCCICVEVKKIFMNEWTGEVDWNTLQLITDAIGSTIPGLLEELEKA